MSKTTKSLKQTEVTRQWYVVDAAKAPLGRVATEVAKLLIGKHKSTYTPHVDGGDHVIVVNAANLVVTGRKLEQKKYYRHSGYIGGIKETSLKDLLEKNPESVIEKAVKGMLPRNKLTDGRLKRLHVYADNNHSHEAQKPTTYNPKEDK